MVLEILPPDADSPIVSIALSGPPPTRGPSGAGESYEVTDRMNRFTFAEKYDIENAQRHHEIRWDGPVGLPIKDAVAAAEVAAALHRPNRFAIRLAGAPRLGGAIEIVNEQSEERVALLGILSRLRIIQQHTVRTLVVPGIDDISAQAEAWKQTAALLEGAELAREWDGQLALVGHMEEEFAADLASTTEVAILEFPLALTVQVGNQEEHLGQTMISTGQVRVQEVDRMESGEVRAVVVPYPGSSGRLTSRYIGVA